MASEGPLSPGTVVSVAGANYDWTTPAEAVSSNDVYAFCSIAVPFGTSDLLRATNFGFDISAGATIDGVVVELEAYSEQSICNELELYLVKAGVRTGDNRAEIFDMWLVNDDDTYHSRGGAADLWGASLSPEDVGDSGFGVEVAAFNNDEISDKGAFVDHIRMTVYYTESAGPPTTIPQVGVFDPHLNPQAWF